MAAKTTTRKKAAVRTPRATGNGDEAAPSRRPACPACDEQHASSILSLAECAEIGLKVETLPKANAYRVYVHVEDGEAAFYALPHK